MRKYVFSSTLTAAEWNNTTIIPGDPVAAVRELKEQGDRHLVIYGYGQLPQTLLEHGLVDQLNFVINPVMVGCVWLVTDTRTDRANLSGSAGVVFDPVAVEADGNPGGEMDDRLGFGGDVGGGEDEEIGGFAFAVVGKA